MNAETISWYANLISSAKRDIDHARFGQAKVTANRLVRLSRTMPMPVSVYREIYDSVVVPLEAIGF
jgi:hypothetical protein